MSRISSKNCAGRFDCSKSTRSRSFSALIVFVPPWPPGEGTILTRRGQVATRFRHMMVTSEKVPQRDTLGGKSLSAKVDGLLSPHLALRPSVSERFDKVRA